MSHNVILMYMLMIALGIAIAIIVDFIINFRRINRRNMHLEHCYVEISYIVHEVLEDNDFLLNDCVTTSTRMHYSERASEHIKKLNNRLTAIRRDLKYGDYHADIIGSDCKGDTQPEKP